MIKKFLCFFVSCLTFIIPMQSQAVCKDGDIAIEVLGSGGPIADDDRASSGYLIWLDGKAKILVDAGGGVFLRYGQSKAQFEDLDAIVLTHLHADHSSDLPALLKSSYFAKRLRPLKIYGPSGFRYFPDTTDFVNGLLNSDDGVYRYLDDFINGNHRSYQINTHDVKITNKQAIEILKTDDYRLSVVSVHHGAVPAIAVLVEAKDKRMAISGDQSNDNPGFAKMIKGVDLLIMAHAIPEGFGGVVELLHATPRYIGELANNAKVKQLVLSHLMARSLNSLEENKQLIKENYNGPLKVADDLVCYYP